MEFLEDYRLLNVSVFESIIFSGHRTHSIAAFVFSICVVFLKYIFFKLQLYLFWCGYIRRRELLPL